MIDMIGTLIRFEDTWDVEALSRYVALANPPKRSDTLTGHTLVALADYKQKATEEYLRVQRLPCCPKKARLKGAQATSAEQVRRLAGEAGVTPRAPLVVRGPRAHAPRDRPAGVQAGRQEPGVEAAGVDQD